MGRRALFEKYISGLRAKKEEPSVQFDKGRWVTFTVGRDSFNEATLMSILGAFGLDVPLVCKTAAEQLEFYGGGCRFYVKCKLFDDKTFRVFLSLQDNAFGDCADLADVCQAAIVHTRLAVKTQQGFIPALRGKSYRKIS